VDGEHLQAGEQKVPTSLDAVVTSAAVWHFPELSRSLKWAWK
jgi:hypothetical protein